MLHLSLTPTAHTTISVWKMEEETSAIREQARVCQIAGFDEMKPKRQREKAFVQLLLQRQRPGAAIGHHPSGKPFLIGEEGTGISISHSGDFACLMLSDSNTNIGIDIEKTSSRDKVMRVRHKFMAEAEVALHPTACEGTDALLAWTTKEALYKIAGETHFDLLNSFRIEECHLEDTNKGYSLVKDLLLGTAYRVEHVLTDDYVLTYKI